MMRIPRERLPGFKHNLLGILWELFLAGLIIVIGAVISLVVSFFAK